MDNKRWIGLVLAVLIFVVSTLIPSFKTEEEEKLMDDFVSQLGLPGYMAGPGGVEEIIREGDKNKRVMVVTLEGTIAQNAPYGPGYTHEDLLDQLKTAQEDETVEAVLFVLNTGGGTIFESEEIRQEVLALKDLGKPVYASMRNMTASGGYYIASQADKIFAYPDTVTGSIGVVMQSIDTTGLQKKLGVEVKEYTAGQLKRVDKASEKEAVEKQDKVYQDYVNEGYDRFTKIVAEGREMDIKKVKEIADGRIYTATQALELDLIDKLGSTDEALDALIEDSDLGSPQVFHYVYNPNLGLPGFMSLLGKKSDLDMAKDLLSNSHKSAPQAYYIYGGVNNGQE